MSPAYESGRSESSSSDARGASPSDGAAFPASVEDSRIVVAMSGGVDSCAAALLLRSQGYSIIGVSMQVWDYRKNGGNSARATCCAPSDFADARKIADRFDFPFYVFDFEDSFHDAVIRPFVDSYMTGYTPNPCLDCNRKVKFRQLRSRARSLGALYIATGHYAQIRLLEDGRRGLFTSADRAKDQSYFLYEMNQDDLAATLFPVGHMTKPEVREILRAHGLEVAEKAESQDICFVSSSVADFIAAEKGGEQIPGKFIDSEGRVLGEHGGIHQFTVGQRRGLGVSHRSPLYVINIDPEERTVTLGERDALARESFSVSGVSWVSEAVPSEPVTVLAKLRYRHEGVRCRVIPTDSPDSATVEFLDSWSAVSPGQAAVFYGIDTDAEGYRQLLGGGRIMRDERLRSAA